MKAVFLLLCAAMALTGVAPSDLVKRSTACPNGWTEISGRCFYYVPDPLNWAEAEKKCQTMNANLASVHSSSEYRSIQMMIAKITHGFGRTWIGGTDCQMEGIWLWSDGTAFDYTHCGVFDNRYWRQHCLCHELRRKQVLG
ncbi:ladderlectin-like isoform X1 [Hippoglossus stenolepis]|uniref:ladderlectin-like isoform X1 n=1 Tax=Hippoglossus stenolepis TaxID=195615 RepID=UPI001FAFABB9|nr:ladderlectin-like isoform X1 [Hippoglossus stenolepis]